MFSKYVLKKAPVLISAFAPPLGLEPNRALRKHPVDVFSDGVSWRADLGETKTQKKTPTIVGVFCSSSWTRTKDPLINSQML